MTDSTKGITLRPCPHCKTPVHSDYDHGPILTSENVIDLSDGATIYAMGYTVRCISCGASVSDEYLAEIVQLWNGKRK